MGMQQLQFNFVDSSLLNPLKTKRKMTLIRHCVPLRMPSQVVFPILPDRTLIRHSRCAHSTREAEQTNRLSFCHLQGPS